MMTPIVQFGTSRFLQAHVDLFVSQALRPQAGAGPIAVVQTSGAPERAGRVAAFDAGRFPVRLRGLRDGSPVDETIEVRSVRRGLSCATQWAEIVRIVAEEATTIVSNTGDRGYELSPDDAPDDAPDDGPPRSFPAKLTVLLRARYHAAAAPLDLYPCELVSGNGDTLRRAVLSVAGSWSLEPGFADWLEFGCRWVNSLVDRIVSEPIEPLGAVAEPYALWAIEAQPGLAPPCRHDAIVLTERLADYERLKLFILNLGHTALVELWRARGSPAGMTVRRAVEDTPMRAALDEVYEAEVLPVFAAIGQADAARAYRDETLHRFGNPFLAHALSDIAQNHAAKRERRFRPVIELAARHVPGLAQPRLRQWLGAP